MKQIIITMICLYSLSTFSQTTFDGLIDPRMAIDEHGLNVMVKISTDQRFFNLIESMRVGVSMEAYSKREFYSLNFTYGYVYHVNDKLHGVAGIQVGWIFRTNVPTHYGEGNGTWATVGLNGTIRYYPFNKLDKLGIIAYGTWVTRGDIQAWGDDLDNNRINGYLGITFRLN